MIHLEPNEAEAIKQIILNPTGDVADSEKFDEAARNSAYLKLGVTLNDMEPIRCEECQQEFEQTNREQSATYQDYDSPQP